MDADRAKDRERPLLTAVVDSFDRLSAAQQLVDRFLLGYPSEGDFREPTVRLSRLHAGSTRDDEVERRRLLFGIDVSPGIPEAVDGAAAILVVRKRPWLRDGEQLLRTVLDNAPRGAAVFAWALPGATRDEAMALKTLAERRSITLSSGTFFPVTWRLPPMEPVRGGELSEALLTAVGEPARGYVEGFDALQSLVERRRGGEAGVREVIEIEGKDVWQFFAKDSAFRELLAAAVSRSDTPRGDPERDGRTQDIVGLGLLPGLVADPRLALLLHADGLRSAVVLLNGGIRDHNFAIRDGGGRLSSAQLYLPPAPGEHHYSRLVRLLESFFVTGKPSHPLERNLLVCGVVEGLLGEGGVVPSPGGYQPFRRSEYRRENSGS